METETNSIIKAKTDNSPNKIGNNIINREINNLTEEDTSSKEEGREEALDLD